MKKFSRLLIVCLGLLTVCLLPIGAPAQVLQGHQHPSSGVIGRVTGSMGDFDTGVIISTVAGVSVTSVETIENGAFIVGLPSGNYVLRVIASPKPVPGGATPNYLILGPSIPVTVRKDRFTIIKLPLSLGKLPSLPLH